MEGGVIALSFEIANEQSGQTRPVPRTDSPQTHPKNRLLSLPTDPFENAQRRKGTVEIKHTVQKTHSAEKAQGTKDSCPC